jgi:hypothetical protein
MNRLHLSFSLLAVFFAGALVVSGCKAPTVGYQISQFSTLRVMDFAPFYDGNNCSPTAPMDAYWFLTGQTLQPLTLANASDLTYGEASVYTNLIVPGNYNVLFTPHLILKDTDLFLTGKTAITLGPNLKYSLIVARASSGQFSDTLIQDGVPNPAQNLAYVRFINMQPNTSGLSVHVNDPVTGELINSTPLSFNQVSSYATLQTALDSSYAFFVTNSASQVIARLSYQTFTGGNCYTLVYAGDQCETTYHTAADSTQSALDTLRLRAFDDNSLGSDLTNPIQPSFRFNIVNDIIPTSPPTPSYSFTYSQDTDIGFIVDGQTFPEFYNFTVPPIPAYQGGGENVASYEPGGALIVNYQSLLVPTAFNFQGYATNGSGSDQQALFNSGNMSYVLSEGVLTGVNAANYYNKPFTFLLYDSLPDNASTPPSYLDTALPGKFALIQVPDTATANAATILFISGVLLYEKPNNLSTANYSLFYVTDGAGNTLGSVTGANDAGIQPPTSKVIQIPFPSGQTTMPLTIIDSIGNTKATRVPGNTVTFTAQAGGIYEIVSEGVKTNPHLLIMHVNSDQ